MFCVLLRGNQLNNSGGCTMKSETDECSTPYKQGGVPERLIGAVLKTVERASVPWVRIPPPPPF